jgi:hypothetical protein
MLGLLLDWGTSHAQSRVAIRVPEDASARPYRLGIRRAGGVRRAGRAVPGRGREVYGESGIVSAAAQRAAFASVLAEALAALPPRTGILIDLSAAAFVSRAPLTRLRRLADTGVTVTIRGDEAAVAALAGNGLNLGESLLLAPTAPS